jgi:hypothetical protein
MKPREMLDRSNPSLDFDEHAFSLQHSPHFFKDSADIALGKPYLP